MSPQETKYKALRRQAERMLQSGVARGGIPPEDLAAILHELEVQQIELQLQNEELQRSQQELQQARENYFSLYELAPVGYLTLNSKLLITRANIAASQLLRQERRFLLNGGFSRFINPADYPRFRDLLRESEEKGGSRKSEMELVLPGGGRLDVLLECAREQQKEADPEYRLAIIDISEQHQAKLTLQQANAELEERVAERTRELKTAYLQLAAREEKYRTIADYTCDWEYWLSEKGECLYNSPSCVKICGYSPEEFTAEPGLCLDVVHPEDRDMVARHRLQEVEDRKLPGFDFRLIHKDGTVRWVSHICRPVYNPEGEFVGRRGSLSDITTRKKFELDLQQARVDLETRVRERTRELEEANVALTVLLRKRTEDRHALEGQIHANAADLVEPYLDKLENSPLTPAQKNILVILKANLAELVSPFRQTLGVKFARLTPTEIQVANLVKLGRKTKEIAELLNLAPGTIDIHRKNIRKKLGLTNQGGNLQSALVAHAGSDADLAVPVAVTKAQKVRPKNKV